MGGRLWWRAAAIVVVGAHLLALYWPRIEVTGPVSWSDKVAHVVLFGMPVVMLGSVLERAGAVMGVFAIHAPVSELIQSAVLPGRSGDLRDMLADLAGVALGAAVLAVRARVRGPSAARSGDRSVWRGSGP